MSVVESSLIGHQRTARVTLTRVLLPLATGAHLRWSYVDPQVLIDVVALSGLDQRQRDFLLDGRRSPSLRSAPTGCYHRLLRSRRVRQTNWLYVLCHPDVTRQSQQRNVIWMTSGRGVVLVNDLLVNANL